VVALNHLSKRGKNNRIVVKIKTLSATDYRV